LSLKAIVTAMFAIVMVVVPVMVSISVVMIVMVNHARSNEYGSSMASMMTIVMRRDYNADTDMDLSSADWFRSGQGSHSEEECAQGEQYYCFSMFHYVLLIFNILRECFLIQVLLSRIALYILLYKVMV
jgi:hypothetical protein